MGLHHNKSTSAKWCPVRHLRYTCFKSLSNWPTLPTLNAIWVCAKSFREQSKSTWEQTCPIQYLENLCSEYGKKFQTGRRSVHILLHGRSQFLQPLLGREYIPYDALQLPNKKIWWRRTVAARTSKKECAVFDAQDSARSCPLGQKCVTIMGSDDVIGDD